MKYLLDTNACVDFLRGRSQKLIERLSQQASSDVVVCSIVRAELFAGAYKSNETEKNFLEVEAFLKPYRTLPFDDSVAKVCGRVRADLEKTGKKIGPNDIAIAAIALANDLILVTHNVGEFNRVEGLRIEDWQAENR